jgi:hypothetical protein
MKNPVLCDTAPRSQVKIDQYFRRIYRFRLQGGSRKHTDEFFIFILISKGAGIVHLV